MSKFIEINKNRENATMIRKSVILSIYLEGWSKINVATTTGVYEEIHANEDRLAVRYKEITKELT